MSDEFDPDLPYGGHAPSQGHSPTSMAAGASIEKTIGPLHLKVLDYLTRHPGATDEILCDKLLLGGNTLRPRRRELQLMGYVLDSGKVMPTRSGRNAVIWILNRSKT